MLTVIATTIVVALSTLVSKERADAIKQCAERQVDVIERVAREHKAKLGAQRCLFQACALQAHVESTRALLLLLQQGTGVRQLRWRRIQADQPQRPDAAPIKLVERQQHLITAT